MIANEFYIMSTIERKRNENPTVEEILAELRENGVDVQILKISNDNWLKMDALRKQSIQPVTLDK